MAFKITTDVTSEPVTLQEARLQCKLTDSDTTTEDALIVGWITAAREAAEHYCGRMLAPKTVEVPFDAFPGCLDASFSVSTLVGISVDTSSQKWRDPRSWDIVLPAFPVTAITGIKYIDPDGVEQTLATDQYTLNDYGDARVITLNYGCNWPATRRQANAVKIIAVVGYAHAPKAAKSAMLLTIEHLFNHRGDVVVDARAVAVQMPSGAQALLDTIKVWRH